MSRWNGEETSTSVDVVWGLIDQVNLLKTIFKLEKLANNAHAHGAKVEIATKKEKLRTLLQDNTVKRIERAKERDIDTHHIKDVLKDEKEERLSLQHLTIQKAIAAKDARLFDSNKMVCLIRYVQNLRTKKLELLKQKHDDLCSHVRSAPIGYDHTKEVLTTLENNMDKSDIKYNTSRVLVKKYRELIDHLKAESGRMPTKLDEMEMTLRETTVKIQYFRKVVVDAKNEEDAAKKQLARLEASAIEGRRKREAELQAVRKKIDQMRHEAHGRVDKRITVHLILGNTLDRKTDSKEAQDRQQRQVIALTDQLERIMSAAKISKLEDIVPRVGHGDEFQTRLTNLAEELKAHHLRSVNEHSSLTRKYNNLKYGGLAEIDQRGNKDKFKNSQLTGASTELDRIAGDVEEKAFILVRIKRGFDALEEKLKDIEVPDDTLIYDEDNVTAKCQRCIRKLDALKRQIEEAKAKGPTMPPPGETSVHNKLDDYVERNEQAGNIRVKLCTSESTISDYTYDLGVDDPECLTSADIKRIGLRLIDSKTRSRKRKPKKK